MFTVYENEINRIKSEKQNFEVLNEIDIDNFLKELEDSFIILKTMPSLYQTKYRELDFKMSYFKEPDIHEILLGRFISFKEHIFTLASLIKDEKYQDIIRQETKKTFEIIMACFCLSILAVSIAMATVSFQAAFPAILLFLADLFFIFLTYSELSKTNKYELALTNDVKNLTASVKNNPCFFDPCYDKSEVKSNNEIFDSIGNPNL